MVQQSVTGTGQFNGANYGRALGRFPASATLGMNTVVRVAARLHGTDANAYTVSFVDPGIDTANTVATQLGSAITVTLRRQSGVIAATSQNVAEAINRAGLPISASYEGNGNGAVAAQAATPIINVKSGADSSLRGPNADQFIWSLPSNTDGGLFYFENDQQILIHQFEALFNVPSGGPYTVTVSRVNLDSNLEVISGESIPVFVWEHLSTARPDVAFSDVGIIVHPFQALSVATTGALTGVVRFDVRKTAGYPYP